MDPDRALKKLIEGNQRFSKGDSLQLEDTIKRRKETISNQEPFAAILGCSDSRVAPEIIFDQGIGDLFIVRVAGNVVGPVELDSIEYSAVYLHSSIIVVLGHQNCGAVKAILQGKRKDIEAVAELIDPAIEKTKNQKGDRLENIVKANVKMMVEQLKKSEALSKLIESKKLAIRGGYYNFQTGEVELL